MKKIGFLFIALLGLTITTQAQEFKKNLGNSPNHEISIMIVRSDFKIVGYNGNEVVIDATGYQPPPPQAKGLHALYNSAVDNTGIGLSVETNNGVMKIVNASRGDAKYVVKVPDKVALTVGETFWGNRGIHISNMKGEIDVKAKTSNVTLENVSGPVIANSISGKITVVFSGLNQTKPTAISSVSGPIDITLPANTKANFNMRSVTGEIYTDFQMQMKNKENSTMQQIGGNLIKSSVNGGGVEMNLKTVSSNIYVRKKK